MTRLMTQPITRRTPRRLTRLMAAAAPAPAACRALHTRHVARLVSAPLVTALAAALVALVALAALAAVLPRAAAAQDMPIGFQTPSKNIHCVYFGGETRTVVRCDIRQATITAPRPRDCDLEWGQAFEIGARDARGVRLCYGDTVMDERLPVLGYGATFQRGGFTCTSEPSGVSCFNAQRHGFSVARAAQSVF